ncbi:hypothetical protein AeMF1_012676 [Aphanomyces euteiches]|nr:hypothetical protein AeMF1_012676 [Aphanomyces euteiches]KAH9189396.1 hypothetical protein AeNC1_008629 [Aphanomyces euteiches]
MKFYNLSDETSHFGIGAEIIKRGRMEGTDAERYDEIEREEEDDEDHKLEHEELHVGEVIAYYSTVFVTGDPRGRRESKVMRIRSDVGHDYPIHLESQDTISRSAMIKRIKAVDGNDIQAPGGGWRKVYTFELIPGKIRGETASAVLKAAMKNVVRDAYAKVYGKPMDDKKIPSPNEDDDLLPSKLPRKKAKTPVNTISISKFFTRIPAPSKSSEDTPSAENHRHMDGLDTSSIVPRLKQNQPSGLSSSKAVARHPGTHSSTDEKSPKKSSVFDERKFKSSSSKRLFDTTKPTGDVLAFDVTKKASPIKQSPTRTPRTASTDKKSASQKATGSAQSTSSQFSSNSQIKNRSLGGNLLRKRPISTEIANTPHGDDSLDAFIAAEEKKAKLRKQKTESLDAFLARAPSQDKQMKKSPSKSARLLDFVKKSSQDKQMKKSPSKSARLLDFVKKSSQEDEEEMQSSPKKSRKSWQDQRREFRATKTQQTMLDSNWIIPKKAKPTV